jgi:hypothetical protein
MHDGDYEIAVPPELLGGVYANLLGVWHTEHEFTLDFASAISQEGGILGVSRIRVAPTVVFELMQNINRELAIYEQKYGAIRRPGANEGDT